MRFRYDDRALQGISQEFERRLQGLPEAKRRFLNDVGGFAVSLLQSTYEGNVVLGHRYATRWRGKYGESILLSVAVGPQRSWATVRITSPYAKAIDQGRPAGPVPPEVIKEWAADKLGLDPDGVEVKRILYKIWRQGTIATNITYISWSPSTAKGRALDDFINERLDLLLAEVGLRSKQQHIGRAR